MKNSDNLTIKTAKETPQTIKIDNKTPSSLHRGRTYQRIPIPTKFTVPLNIPKDNIPDNTFSKEYQTSNVLNLKTQFSSNKLTFVKPSSLSPPIKPTSVSPPQENSPIKSIRNRTCTAPAKYSPPNYVEDKIIQGLRTPPPIPKKFSSTPDLHSKEEIPSNETNSNEIKEEKKKPIHEYILEELLQTEKTYNNQLGILLEAKENFEKLNNFFKFIDEKKIIENFFDNQKSLKNEEIKNTSVKPEEKKKEFNNRIGLRSQAHEVLKKLFNKIEQLKLFSDLFLLAMKEENTPKNIATLMSKFDFHSFNNAGDLYSNYVKIQRKLTKNEHEKFIKKLNKLIPKQDSQLEFEAYAITIVQRLPRYGLFINDLIKHINSAQFPQEFENLKKASANTTFGTDRMNKAVRQSIILNPSVLPYVAQVQFGLTK